MQAYQDCHNTTKAKRNSMTNNSLKPKRSQVKNACINCKKACKKCDDGRPCQRCIKYNLVDTCKDSIRKKRKREKRGPYKKKHNETGDVKQSTNNILSSPLLTLSTVPVLPITMETYMPPEQQQELSAAKIYRIIKYHQEQQAYHRNQSKCLIGTFPIVSPDSLHNTFQAYTWDSRDDNKDLDYANSIKSSGTINDSMFATFH
ncbi:Putative Potential fungal zinc cluster transcription factor [Rhizopus microsporus]|nr:Putative Potential fungal zinc cluster transcription factor [Rhizopus microsporus]